MQGCRQAHNSRGCHPLWKKRDTANVGNVLPYPAICAEVGLSREFTDPGTLLLNVVSTLARAFLYVALPCPLGPNPCPFHDMFAFHMLY